jgi:hypothetical protein
MKDINFKGARGYHLLLWGLAITVLPFVLIMVDLALRGGGDANIGIGVLGLLFVPSGLILTIIGLVLVLSSNLKKKK